MIRTNIKRIPIINRVPIKRIPIKLYSVNCDNCLMKQSCSHMKLIHDCRNTPFYSVDLSQLTLNNINKLMKKISSEKIFPYVYLIYNDNNSAKILEKLLQNLAGVNIPAYIVTSEPLPEECIDIMSSNPYNIIQATINCNDFSEKASNLREMFYVSRNCGIHTILRIEPIIPCVTKSYDVIDLINSVKNCCNHVSIKFVEINRSFIDSEYICYENWCTPTKYYDYKDNKYMCSDEFIENFMKNILLFIGNKTISICGTEEECRGIPIKLSMNNDGIFSVLSEQETIQYIQEGNYENNKHNGINSNMESD